MTLTPYTTEDFNTNRRLVIAPWGQEKTGKTTFAFTFPDPIYFFNFDIGEEGVVDERIKGLLSQGRKVFHAEYVLDPMDGLAEQRVVYGQFKKDYDEAVSTAPLGATIIIDTGTALEQLVRDVTMDEVQESRRGTKSEGRSFQYDYHRRNQEMNRLWTAANARRGVNFVFVHKSSPVYDSGGNRTSQIELQGWSGTLYTVATVLQLYKQPGPTGQAEQFFGRMNMCRQDSRLVGLPLENPTYTSITELLWG